MTVAAGADVARRHDRRCRRAGRQAGGLGATAGGWRRRLGGAAAASWRGRRRRARRRRRGRRGRAGGGGRTGVPLPPTTNQAPLPFAPGAATSASAPAPSSEEPAATSLPVMRTGARRGDLRGGLREVGGRCPAAPLHEIGGAGRGGLAGRAGEHVEAAVAVDVARGARARRRARRRRPGRRSSAAAAWRRGCASSDAPGRGRRRPRPEPERPFGEAPAAPIARSRMPSPFWSPTPASEVPSWSPGAGAVDAVALTGREAVELDPRADRRPAMPACSRRSAAGGR